MTSKAITVAIMAGGQSTRMGTDKALIPWRGTTLIEAILTQVRDLGAESIVITNTPEAYAFLGVPLFSDVLPGKGALGGLYTALHAATQPHTLCLACDMPFVVRPLLEHLIALSAEGDVIMPRLNGEAEPFRALYAQTCREPIRAALDAGKMRVISFFPAVRVRFVDEPELAQYDPRQLSFFNVNTPADLAHAQQIASDLWP